MTASGLRGLYVILDDRGEGPALERLAAAVLAAGVPAIQYRAKGGVRREVLARLRALTARAGTLLIVNDDVEAALAAGADGVHLGQEDAAGLDLARVRARLPGKLLGLSCGTPVEAQAAQAAGADYVGAGCTFATRSKADAGPPIGTAGVRRLVAATTLPVIAIGGITLANVAEVAASGAAMAAVISAVADAPDPGRAVRALSEAFLGAAAAAANGPA